VARDSTANRSISFLGLTFFDPGGFRTGGWCFGELVMFVSQISRCPLDHQALSTEIFTEQIYIVKNLAYSKAIVWSQVTSGSFHEQVALGDRSKGVVASSALCVVDVEPLSTAPAPFLSTSLTDDSSRSHPSFFRLALHIP